jgi:hypothetical protein
VSASDNPALSFKGLSGEHSFRDESASIAFVWAEDYFCYANKENGVQRCRGNAESDGTHRFCLRPTAKLSAEGLESTLDPLMTAEGKVGAPTCFLEFSINFLWTINKFVCVPSMK